MRLLVLPGGIARDDIILSPSDAARYGLQEGATVRLVNDLGSFDGVVRVMDIAEGCVQTYWPESNVLIPRIYDPISKEPDYNCLVQLEKR